MRKAFLFTLRRSAEVFSTSNSISLYLMGSVAKRSIASFGLKGKWCKEVALRPSSAIAKDHFFKGKTIPCACEDGSIF